VAFTLKSAGFEVLEGADGSQGLSVLDGRPVSVIITDLNMPVMDGFTFIRNLRKKSEYRFTPVLMLTTEANEAKKKEGREAGATGWIVKPFNPQQLLKVIAKVLP